MKQTTIEDTFSECFNMWCARVLITAADEELAHIAATSTTGFATSIIMCSAEAGIERIIPANQTPDGRPGIIIQIWTRKSSLMKDELLTRLSQCAMTTPTANIFNYLEEGEKSEQIGKMISYFGDGFQKQVTLYNRVMWEIPVMDGLFLIEDTFKMIKGVAGGVLIIVGSSIKDTLQATKKAIKMIQKASLKVITSFPGGICRAGSKIGSKYSFLHESTNHKFCPTLKSTVPDTFLAPNVSCCYEIVINAINEDELKKAMRVAINAIKNDKGLIKITSSNYGGQLGSINIHLRKLF